MEKQDGLRAALIAAALTMLEAAGEEPSLRAVARAAGVSAMAPYRHFADKAALMAAVAGHGFERLRAMLEAADARGDARDALFAQGRAFVDFARANPALYRLMYSPQWGSADSEAVRATYEILARRVAGLRGGDDAAATLACRAMAQGLATIALSGRMAPGEAEAVDGALRMLVAGVVG